MENKQVDEVKVVGSTGAVNVRSAAITTDEEGKEISRTYHRHVIMPGDDYSNEPQEVQDVCAEAHTQEVIDAYISSIKPEPLTPEEQAEADQREAKRLERQAKLDGFEFEGVMCSVHKEDQWGLATIKPLVEAGQSVPFHFKNGNVLLLTPDNLATFEQEWTAFRMGFFQ